MPESLATTMPTFDGKSDFKSEYLFCMCSVVTNLVTSLEFEPIPCASTLCHFRPTRNVYVATRFILLSSTAESRSTNGNVVLPEHSGQGEVRACKNEERATKSLVLFPAVNLIDAACNHM